MKFTSFSILLLLLPLTACGTVNIDPLANVPESAKKQILENLPRPVYKQETPVAHPSTQPPVTKYRTALIDGSQGVMNCRYTPGGAIKEKYLNGEVIEIDRSRQDVNGIWYHAKIQDCYIFQNGLKFQ